MSLYALHSATSNSQGLTFLRSGTRFHVCILDLGINDIENDEFYILRQYARHCSIIVLTGSRSPNKGATCIQLGARAVLEKGASFRGETLFDIINRCALLNIVNHRYNENGGDTLSYATKVLLEKKPQSVTEWADYMRITDRQLRNLWHTCSGFSAKHVLFLYGLLSHAFEYYSIQLFGTPEARKSMESGIDQKYSSYFQKNKEVISFLLS